MYPFLVLLHLELHINRTVHCTDFLCQHDGFNIHLWNSSTLATSCEELTHWKRLWCWEGLKAGGEGDNRGWDGWMVSLTQWTWVWVNSGSWWWTGGLACCDSWGHRESDTTEPLIWSDVLRVSCSFPFTVEKYSTAWQNYKLIDPFPVTEHLDCFLFLAIKPLWTFCNIFSSLIDN